MEELSIDKRLAHVIALERLADELYLQLKELSPAAWDILKKVDTYRAQAEEEKKAVREDLIASQDFSNYQVGGYNISVSRTVKLGVADPDTVSSDFKKTEEIIDIKQAQEFMKVMKTIPAGFEDKSTYRLNWKEIKNV